MNDPFEYKGFLGSVEYSSADERFFGKIQCIDSLIMFDGESVPELKSSFQDAVDSYLAFCAERGIEPNKPYSGLFNVRVGTELHRKAVHYAVRNNIKLNDVVVRAIESLVHANGVEKIEQHNHYYVGNYEIKEPMKIADPALGSFMKFEGAQYATIQ